MIHEKISLYSDDNRVTLTSYIHETFPELRVKRRPALIILPGGGLEFLSEREAEPVVFAFMQFGVNAFILRYSIREFGNFPLPLLDASQAVTYVRRNADKYNIDPNRIFIMGFSAGGYIAAMLGTRWHEPFIREEIGISYGENRPDGMILCYPVITAGKFAHVGTINVSIKDSTKDTDNVTEDLLTAHSIECQVTEKTPPAFIWHTASDNTVPVENSLLLATALSEHKVPFELHIYPEGQHGLSLANAETSCGSISLINGEIAEWVGLAGNWILSH